jgi:hypothetical protein
MLERMGSVTGERSQAAGTAGPTRVGQLIIECEVTRGPASVVYAARASEPGGGRVAVKAFDPELRALHPQASGFEAAHDPRVARFRAASETGELPQDRLYRVTDLVQGAPSTLAELGSLRHAVVFWARVARALGRVHAHGLAHGFVKPSHAVVLPDRHPLVLDAGIVPTPLAARRDPRAAVFLPPEAVSDLLQGKTPRATPRGDVYATGASLTAALGGSPPGARALSTALSLDALAAAKESSRPPVVTAVTVPVRALDLRALGEALARALDPDADARFPDGLALARALESAARVNETPRSGVENSEGER